MKKKLILLLPALIIMVVVALVLLAQSRSEYKAIYYNENDIDKIVITVFPFYSSEFSATDFEITGSTQIRIVLDSVKRMKEAKRNELKGVESPSSKYTYEYYFKDGKIITANYTVPPNNLGDPLSEIWKLEEVMRQVRPIFTVDVSQIRNVIFYHNTPQGAEEQEMDIIGSVEYLIHTGQQMMIEADGVFNFFGVSFGLKFLDEHDEVLCSIPFSQQSTDLTEIRNQIPEIDHTLTLWGP